MVQIKIGSKEIKFHKTTTWRLAIWLNSQLKFTAHVNKNFQRARTAKNQIKRLTWTYKLALAQIQRIQIIVV